MRGRSTLVLSILAAAVALAGAACTAPSGSGVLSVTNRSEETIYVRFDAEPGQVVIYRIDPGAVGRVQAVDPGRRPDTMIIYAGDCSEMSQQSDPALGTLEIETGSFVFSAATDPDVASKPLLPVDGRCR